MTKSETSCSIGFVGGGEAPRKIAPSSLPRASIVDNEQVGEFGILATKEHVLSLSCSSCSNLYDNPIALSCGHSFCYKCLKTHIQKMGKTCPQCKIKLNSTFPCVNLGEATKTLKVICLQQRLHPASLVANEQSCEEPVSKRPRLIDGTRNYCEGVVLWGMVAKHLQVECPFWKVDCKFKCGFTDLRFLTVNHEEHCLLNPSNSFVCEKCHQMNPLITKEKHLEICPMELIPCQSYGCNQLVPRGDMDCHLKKDSGKHFEIIKSLMDKKEAMIIELETKLQNQT